ncbi:MAG TPA: hypothetical protein VFF74_05930 [Methylophilaceae bacterium]|nr:hypothetical protein [Methylophilaceae bacterium]
MRFRFHHIFNNGYTYFGILFVVMLISLALVGASLVWQVQQQRQKEQQLLFIGQQYMKAIASYYHSAPGGNKRYPKTLTVLLRDPRFPTITRHLRKPWRDPLTLSHEWGLVRTKQGGIAGIYSRGTGMPIKRLGFGSKDLDKMLGNKKSYRDWKFVYVATTNDTLRGGGITAAGDAGKPVTAEESVRENARDMQDLTVPVEDSAPIASMPFDQNSDNPDQPGAAEESGEDLLPQDDADTLRGEDTGPSR